MEARQKHKPLILRGARQVGKTTVVNEFGSQFDNYLYFNLERNENAKLFEMEIPLDDLVNMLYASVGKVKKEGTTLVFIDEIQNSPKTIALLRYFYEQRPDLYVIAAGSLLENLVDVKVSFPVGRVQYLALRPCSFSEFLGAIGKNNLLAVLSQKAEYTVAFHEQLMHLFNQYTIVGGMPEAVQLYAETQDVIGIEDVYETLVQAYKDDSEKYVRGNKLTDVVRFILSYGWAFRVRPLRWATLPILAISQERWARLLDCWRRLCSWSWFTLCLLPSCRLSLRPSECQNSSGLIRDW